MDDEWADEGADPAQPGLRRADPQHPLNFWWGRDAQGHHVFQLDAPGSISAVSDWPVFANIEVQTSDIDDGRCQLRLLLLDPSCSRQFVALCSTLLEATAHVPNRSAATVLPIVAQQLFDWQAMLSSPVSGSPDPVAT